MASKNANPYVTQYEKNMWVWADHSEDVWCPARIVEISDKQMQVSYLSGDTELIETKKKFSVLSIGSFHEDLNDGEIYKDLSKMASLSTQSVLYFLRKAYFSGIYYSNLGAGTILAINPFQDVEDLFNDEKVYAYHFATLSELESMPAHVFGVAERALHHMSSGMKHCNQSIIISGESGAGKTWTVRCLMRYLAVVGGKSTTPHCRVGKDPIPCAINVTLTDSFVGNQIEHRILSSNPILEAFGNAATPRNHNSSRFGKYIQLQYDRSGNIVGARLQVYLLEKTRVAKHSESERPYHIFSQLLYGSSEQQKSDWLLPEEIAFQDNSVQQNENCNNNVNGVIDDPEVCDNDNESGDVIEGEFTVDCDVDQMDNAAAFSNTCKSMLSVGISSESQNEIFKILSAILHLEKLTFEGDDDVNTPCTLTTECESNCKNASNVLAVPIQNLLQAVTVREIQAGGAVRKRRSVFKRSCTRDECSTRRDALMKYLYEQIFHWLVKHIGNDLSAPEGEAQSFIGLLDVYGFESFLENGLEQLCINYANEKLQQYYVSNFLKLQQEELALEGVLWNGLDRNHTIHCLTVLESPHNSLFALLNEECRLNRASNASQLEYRITERFTNSSHIIRPRIASSAPSFAVLHYAGMVAYETEALIMKNKDELPLEIAKLLLNSRSEFVQNLVSKKVHSSLSESKAARGKYHETVLTEFKRSLDELLTTLSSTNCHYIRCIKPNTLSIPSRFDSFHVVDQLRSSGVVETVQICGHLHPHRISYPHFISQFSFLLSYQKQANSDAAISKVLNGSDQPEAICDLILHFICWKYPDLEKNWKFGKTFLFLSAILFEKLENERIKELTWCVTKIQVAWLSYSHRKRCRELRRRIMEERKSAALLFQRAWRLRILLRNCGVERKTLIKRRHNAAHVIQSAWISYAAAKKRKTAVKQRLLRKAASTIQSAWVTYSSAKKHGKNVKSRQRTEAGTVFSEDGTEVEMNCLMVKNIKTQYASLHNNKTTDLSLHTHRSLTQTPSRRLDSNTFEWHCWSTDNLVFRYFPSMTLMSLHLLCKCFKRPLDLISRCFTQRVHENCFHSFYQTSVNYSFSGDFSISSSGVLNISEVLVLSPNSFSLCEVDRERYSARFRILPFSNVAPKRGTTI